MLVTPKFKIFSGQFIHINLNFLFSFVVSNFLLTFVVSTVSLSLSHWYPGSGVVLDCIDS